MPINIDGIRKLKQQFTFNSRVGHLNLIDGSFIEKNLKTVFHRLCETIIYRYQTTMIFSDTSNLKNEQTIQMPYCPVVDFICQNQTFFASRLEKLCAKHRVENTVVAHTMDLNKITTDILSFLPVPQNIDLKEYLTQHMPEEDIVQLAMVPQDQAWLKAKCIFVSMMRNSDYFKTVIESSAKSCYLFQLFEKQRCHLELNPFFKQPNSFLESKQYWTVLKFAVSASLNPIHGPAERPTQQPIQEWIDEDELTTMTVTADTTKMSAVVKTSITSFEVDPGYVSDSTSSNLRSKRLIKARHKLKNTIKRKFNQQIESDFKILKSLMIVTNNHRNDSTTSTASNSMEADMSNISAKDLTKWLILKILPFAYSVPDNYKVNPPDDLDKHVFTN